MHTHMHTIKSETSLVLTWVQILSWSAFTTHDAKPCEGVTRILCIMKDNINEPVGILGGLFYEDRDLKHYNYNLLRPAVLKDSNVSVIWPQTGSTEDQTIRVKKKSKDLKADATDDAEERISIWWHLKRMSSTISFERIFPK